MRKNGVNKQLYPIDGGICAPAGFVVGGVACDIAKNLRLFSRETENTENIEKEDLGALKGDARYAVAGTFTKASEFSAIFPMTEKTLRSGYARAVLVQNGVTNVYGEKGKRNAWNMRASLAKYATIREEDIIVLSTGVVGAPFKAENVLKNMRLLSERCGRTEENRRAFLNAVGGRDKIAKEFAFSFDLGDFPCKIGAVCNNENATVCIITTDVNISPDMLQKALQSAVSQTFDLLDVNGTSSLSDGIYAIASGMAGNYTISAPDSEYKKFANALKNAMFQICLQISRKRDTDISFVCNVQSARSFRSAGERAKAIVSANDVKSDLKSGRVCVENILNAMYATGEDFNLEKTEISLCIGTKELVLFDSGRTIPADTQTFLRENKTKEMKLNVRLNEGNYSAVSIGRII